MHKIKNNDIKTLPNPTHHYVEVTTVSILVYDFPGVAYISIMIRKKLN